MRNNYGNRLSRSRGVVQSCSLAVGGSCGLAVLGSCSRGVLRSCCLAVELTMTKAKTFSVVQSGGLAVLQLKGFTSQTDALPMVCLQMGGILLLFLLELHGVWHVQFLWLGVVLLVRNHYLLKFHCMKLYVNR